MSRGEWANDEPEEIGPYLIKEDGSNDNGDHSFRRPVTMIVNISCVCGEQFTSENGKPKLTVVCPECSRKHTLGTVGEDVGIQFLGLLLLGIGGVGLLVALFIDWLLVGLMLAMAAIGAVCYVVGLGQRGKIEAVAVSEQGSDDWHRAQESLRELNDVRAVLARDPDHTRRVCHRILEDIQLPLSPRPQALMTAFARARLFTAIVDRRDGRVAAARQSLEMIDVTVTQARLRFECRLEYFLLTNDVSWDAVRTYIGFLSSPTATSEPELARRSQQALRRLCGIRVDMSRNELLQRLQWVRRVRTRIPGQSWARLVEARILMRLDRLSEAEHELTEIASTGDNQSHVVSARALLARLHLAQGDRRRALEEREFLRQAIRRPQHILDLAALDFALGRDAEGNLVLEQAEAKRPELHVAALVLRGKRHLCRSEPRQALDVLGEAVRLEPHHSEAAILLAESHERQGDADSAIRTLRAAVKAHPDSGDAWFAFGCALWNRGQFAEAAKCFQRCVLLNHEPAPLRVLWARCLIRSGQPSQAVEVLEQAAAFDPEYVEQAEFYLGVAESLVSRSETADSSFAAAERAFAHFEVAAKRARAKGHATVAGRAQQNRMFCQLAMAEHLIRRSDFAQAAETFEVLSRGFQEGNAKREACVENSAECYLRVAVAMLKRGHADADATAVGYLEKTLDLARLLPARILRACLLHRLRRYEEAFRAFNDLQDTPVVAEEAQFAEALCLARTILPDVGLTALRTYVHSGNRFSLRAALALAAIESEAEQPAVAAQTLIAALDAPNATASRYYGEACCRAALNLLKAGRSAEARTLVEERLGRGSTIDATYVLGALLAEVGDLESALAYLEQALAARPASELRQLWEAVARRVAANRGTTGNWSGALEIVKRLLGTASTSELSLFAELLQAVLVIPPEGGTLDGAALDLLQRSVSVLGEQSALFAQPLLVGSHRRAYELCQAGQHREARVMWQRAHQVWRTSFLDRTEVWQDFIARFNVGKGHPLELTWQELQTRLQEQFGRFCVLACGERLHGRFFDDGSVAATPPNPALDDVEFYWGEAKQLLGESTAVTAFGELVSVDELARQMVQAGRRRDALSLLKFLHDRITRSEQHATAAANLAFEEALEKLQGGNATEFVALIREAAQLGSQLREMAALMESLGASRIQVVLDCLNKNESAQMLKRLKPSVWQSLAIGLIVNFAHLQKQAPIGLTPEMIRAVFDQLLAAVLSAQQAPA